MTSSEFVTWLKGFTEGVHEYNITPKQWDLLKEKLTQVKTSIGTAEPYFVSSGSTVSYTTNERPTWYSINKIENDSREK